MRSFNPDDVREIIADHLCKPVNNITDSSTWDDIGADSLDISDLLMRFEDDYSLQIPAGDAERIKTVGQAIEYIEKHYYP